MNTSWAGIYGIEHRYHQVRNALVEVGLHGVVGISEIRGGRDHRVDRMDAERFIAKGRDVVAWLEAMQRIPRGEGKRYHARILGELRRMTAQAERVLHGASQTMTETDYKKLAESLRAPYRPHATDPRRRSATRRSRSRR